MRALETFDKLRAFNGADYLTELMSKVVTVENIAYHARIVRGKATARRLVEACREISARGYGEYGDVDEYIDAAEREIFEIAQRSQKQSFEPIKKILDTTIKSAREALRAKQAITGVPSGYHKIDAMTAGLQPGDLIIIAARPSMGKTSFVMNMVVNAAMQKRKEPTARSAIRSRRWCSRSKCRRSRCASVSCARRRASTRRSCAAASSRPSDWIRITKAAGNCREAPILDRRLGRADAARDSRQGPSLARRHEPVLRRRRADGHAWSSTTCSSCRGARRRTTTASSEISEISRGLKALAKELRVPVIALSQLNRSLETARRQAADACRTSASRAPSSRTPTSSRSSIATRSTTKDECKDEDKGVAEIIIGKQRNGPTGTVKLAFKGKYTRFENLAEGRED